MKKRFIGLFLLACFAIAALSITGCEAKEEPINSPSPSAAPTDKPTEKPTEAVSPSPSVSPEASGGADASPSASPSQSAGADEISGFIEGGIVDPDDVPDVTAIFSEGEEYAGDAIQSITYKLHEGRQTYYVVLQGAGGERRFYVYSDLSVTSAEDGN